MRRNLPLWLWAASLALLGCPAGKLKKVLPPDVHVDAYNQQAASRIDVLWVVDNSGSMQPRQALLAKGFGDFIDLFVKGSIDYRIAITTTDIFKDQGKFRGTPSILSPDTPNVVQAFATNVRVGTSGSPYEAGMAAAQMALARQQAANAPKLEAIQTCRLNCGRDTPPLTCIQQCIEQHPVDFLRPDAYLYIVFVSDEEDESSEDVRYYWRTFEESKGIGNDGTVATAAIVGDRAPNDCGAVLGRRYLELSALTGGEVGSICDADFTQTLHKLATNAVGLKRKFALTLKPNVDTLEVTFLYPCNSADAVFSPCAATDHSLCEGADDTSANAACTPQKGGPNGWTYEPETRVVYFAGDSVPGLRATVELQYYEEGKGP